MVVNCTSHDVVGDPITTVDVALGSFFIFAVIISFVPQMISIYTARTSHGLSALFLYAALANACCIVINMLLIQAPQIECCQRWSGSDCAKQMLKLDSVVVQAICLLLTVWLFLKYFEQKTSQAEWTYIKRLFLSLLIMQVVFILIGGAILGAYGVQGTPTVLYGNVQGYIAAAFSFVQVCPQIWTTYKLKDPGSLSLLGLLIQAPGSFGWGAYIVFGGGGGSDWSSSSSLLVCGFFQFILLFMAAYYKWRNRKRKVNYRTLDIDEIPLYDSLNDLDADSDLEPLA